MRNLATSIATEAADMTEPFQWLTTGGSEEIAGLTVFSQMLKDIFWEHVGSGFPKGMLLEC